MESQHQMIVVVVALICIGAMVSVALYRGINGTLLATVVGFVCTIVGYVFGVKKGSE